MAAKRTSLRIAGYLLTGILLGLGPGFLGGIVIKTTASEMLQNSKESAEKGTPVKSVTITIQDEQRELLFDTLRQFAQKNFFATRITSLKPSFYTVDLWREDISVSGSFEEDYGTLDLYFHRNQFEQPVFPPISVTIFDDLKNDLESRIINIPNAIITERYRQLIITTDMNWRNEELLAQMKVFADKHSLEYELSFFDFDPSEKKCFDVEIRGEGFHISSRDCSQDTIEEVDFDFYLDKYKNSPATAQETLDELIEEFKGNLGNIQNATLIEEP